MDTKNTFVKFGFVKDENNLQLKKILKDNIKIKQIHIDTYFDNPLVSSSAFMLLLRAVEKNVVISNNGDRLILKKNDTYTTCFMNILFSKITECLFKNCENCLEFILNIQNIYYKITVFN